MPDEAREVVFPQGLPITMVNGKAETLAPNPVEQPPARSPHAEIDAASTEAEGGLSSEAGVIKDQARQVQPLNDGENLLKVRQGVYPWKATRLIIDGGHRRRQGTQAQSSRIVPVPKPSASRRIFCNRNAVPEAA